MSLELGELKKRLCAFEKIGQWDSVLHILSNEWKKEHSGAIGALCLDQCYLFIEWADDVQDENLLLWRDGYQTLLNNVIEYGLENLEDQPFFMWRLGYLMKGGAGTAYMLLNQHINMRNFDDICRKALLSAYERWPSKLVRWTIELANKNWNWYLELSDEQKGEAAKDLAALNLFDNIVDEQIRLDCSWVYERQKS